MGNPAHSTNARAALGNDSLPRYRYPEELTASERAETASVLDVDGEAYLRWLAGEGPDPCVRESSG